MTAISVCVTSDAAHLFSDAGLMDPACSKIEGIGSKVAILPEYNAVLVANGFTFVEQILRATLAFVRFDHFDALCAGFPEVIGKAVENGVRYGAPADWGNTEIILAGWSLAKNAPTAMVFASYEKFAGKQVRTFIRPMVNISLDPSDIEQSGLRLMQAQRAATFPIEDSGGGLFMKSKRGRWVVHGFCQHTVVTRDSIRTRVLERWPDVVHREPA
ncbi:hypothetical protein IVB36_30205 [Bradyrhizobium sp. 35]|uniref:hypothetical protein n=1 Tax=Bradyrhizobium sp. 35 TaxID=2782670 RepID=UPI001FFA298E|nr:hypothetical protein [Bradyrhizobium sp. 35]MCK1455027.1 hypothetical protein [Bradyrhizobium sp. 35]